LLHGLNLAKLKMQDAELSANIKPVDYPYYPLSPNPTKRKILILAAAAIGFLLVFGTILALEYFDNTLRNLERAQKYLNIKSIGAFPKVLLKLGKLNFLFVANRLLEMAIQQIGTHHGNSEGRLPRTLLFFSTMSNEGKSVTCGNMARKLKLQGKKVLVLNFSRESLQRFETTQLGYTEANTEKSRSGVYRKKRRFSLLRFLLGYPDLRINYNSPFLQEPASYLEPDEYLQYEINAGYFSINSYEDLLKQNNFYSGFVPDYVLIEIPPVLYYSYPQALVASVDLAILVCRANRIWSEADKAALSNLIKHTRTEPEFFLNGVSMQEVESLFGELPKRRSRLNRILRNLIRFQFHNRALP